MNLHRMLEKCRAGQWRVDNLDWSVKPRELSRSDEMLIVQYFTDMAAIERLAKALFEEQRRRTDDPLLHKIFSTFIVDEERHAEVAQRLADHYNVHRYRTYSTNENLVRFRPHFLRAVRSASSEIANVYITGGELMLDIALLRSIDDFVDDDMSKQAMVKINRDESRHIAIDYYMVEHYASPAYQEWMAQQPKPSWRQRREAAWALFNVLRHARPFFTDVFLTPISRCDPSGHRLREAMKRLQLVGQREDVKGRPFVRFINTLRKLYQTPVLGPAFGNLFARAAGVPGEFMVDLYNQEEVAHAQQATFEELAEEALAAKYLH